MLDLLFRDTITVFCRSVENGAIFWYPRVIKNTHAVISSGASSTTRGASNTDNGMVHIMYSGGRDGACIGKYLYVLPKAWAALTPDKKEKSITFTTGEDFGFWMKGSFTEQGPISDESFRDGFYNYMNKKYDDVFAIAQCTQSYIIPHFELVAK